MKLTKTQEEILKKLVISGVVTSDQFPSFVRLENSINRLNNMGADIQKQPDGSYKAIDLTVFEKPVDK